MAFKDGLNTESQIATLIEIHSLFLSVYFDHSLFSYLLLGLRSEIDLE